MKNTFKNINTFVSKLFSTRRRGVLTILTAVLIVTCTVIGVSSCSPHKKPTDTASKPDTSVSSMDSASSEDVTSSEKTENSDVNSEASEDVSSKPSEKKDASSKKDTTSKKPSSSTGSKKPSSSTSSKKPSGNATTQKDYLDTSKLTGTKADVGKVVGYSTLFSKDIVVTKVEEGFNGTGLKYIKTKYSDGSVTCVVECKHCHQMPCPDGGGEKCSEYNIKLDGAETCQTCGLPRGDGYNGTCHVTIDWNNGGKLICHHYN